MTFDWLKNSRPSERLNFAKVALSDGLFIHKFYAKAFTIRK
ncbi:hypothetical protein NEISUBOT_05337 [Neisseria subflava NJ9703]|uniref:Uncharacterized protein n=1 Tax=Neisseria subflava NJ9703 TaxID=546268 RepID=A0A9W5IP88_NEISU|nr:hypothetical protein NEISUBOT_05337 [Neisseria subflava NJ9703]